MHDSVVTVGINGRNTTSGGRGSFFTSSGKSATPRFASIDWRIVCSICAWDFVGDFSVLPARVDLHGTYSKKRFMARYYQGDRLRAILLCQQTQREVDSAKTELRQRLAK